MPFANYTHNKYLYLIVLDWCLGNSIFTSAHR